MAGLVGEVKRYRSDESQRLLFSGATGGPRIVPGDDEERFLVVAEEASRSICTCTVHCMHASTWNSCGSWWLVGRL